MAGNEYLSDVFNMENWYIKKENKLGRCFMFVKHGGLEQ